MIEGNSLYTCGLSVGKTNNIQGFYGLTEKIVNFVRLSKDAPGKMNFLSDF